MAKMTWWVGALAVVAFACSSSTQGPAGGDRCTGVGCIASPVQAGGTETATNGLGAAGESGGGNAITNAGNSTGLSMVAMVAPPSPDMTTGEVTDPADCVEGQFCAPSGPDMGCGSITFEQEVEVTRHPGNVLLVFDRSTSMAMMWNGQERWKAAGDAIVGALTPLQDDIAMGGAVFFPTPDPTVTDVCVDPTGITCLIVPLMVEIADEPCLVAASGSTDQIAFMPGPQFLTQFSSGGPNGGQTYFPVPGGMTPLKEGLMEAQSTLASATLEGQTAVVIITDGEPNCDWDQAVATSIVSDWYSQGISTHVIGLPGVAGTGPQLLNQLASAGGTGQYITPADPAALEMQLKSIISETVKTGFNSCSIGLSPPVQVKDELLMLVTEGGDPMKSQVPRNFGWSINDEGTQVDITGKLCDEAMGGRFDTITFEYACPKAPPPPPIPPLE